MPVLEASEARLFRVAVGVGGQDCGDDDAAIDAAGGNRPISNGEIAEVPKAAWEASSACVSRSRMKKAM